jgi:hypothetical protein
VIARPPRRRRLDALEAQSLQVQRVDEHLDRPHRVLVRHPGVQVLRKQDALTPILTLDEALHRQPPSCVDEQR